MGAVFPQGVHQPTGNSVKIKAANTVHFASLIGARLPVQQPPLARPQRDLAQRFADVGNNDGAFGQFILPYDRI